MLLPYIYRFTLKNEGGNTIAIGGAKVVGLRNRLDVSGNLVYESSEATFLDNAGAILNSGYYNGSTILNTAGWYGGDFICSITGNPINQNAQVLFYLERATNPSNPVFDASGNGFLVAVINSGYNYRAISL